MARSIEAPRWLSVCRHRLGGMPERHVLVLQHDIVGGRNRIVAPIVQDEAIPAEVVTPRVVVEGEECRAILLDMVSVPLRRLGPVVDAAFDEDDILRALDAIFRGYPVGLPIA